MKRITILGKESSKTAKLLSGGKGFQLNTLEPLPELILNCGLQGIARKEWNKRYRQQVEHIPFINDVAQLPKYSMVKCAEAIGIPVPKTYNNINAISKDKWANFIVKKNWSNTDTKKLTPISIPEKGEYIQEKMKCKLYDIRILGFGWIPKSSWITLGREPNRKKFKNVSNIRFDLLKDNVAIQCKNYTRDIFRQQKIMFGAVDFIYSHRNWRLQFINLSLCPVIPLEFIEIVREHFNGLRNTVRNSNRKELIEWINSKY